jgi:uncharacterized protein (TIGR00288 family)
MNTTPRVMLLIDADNVSADVIEQAFDSVMAQYGSVHVRRAYCTAEAALNHQALFRRLSIRPMVNLATGKNSTDIALAVDAIDLVVGERPDVVVIVSSDADYAPLVGRLREKGSRVCGIGQSGKTGDALRLAYDQFNDLTHRKSPVAARNPSKPAGRSKAGAAGQSVDIALDDLAATPPAKRATRSVRPTAPRLAHAAELPAEVQRILELVPELRDGAKLELGIAAEKLRAGGLLSKNAPSTKLFKKHAELFGLTPERQPNKVQFRPPHAA